MGRVSVVALILLGVSAPAWAQGIKAGEYACYSGTHALIGLGFKAYPDGHYTDLDNKERGTYAVAGDSVVFKGGHLDGQVGRNLKNSHFTIHSAACEPN